MTDSDCEEVRGCSDVPVGCLGVWWWFRHCDTSNDGCPRDNTGVNHDCCVDNHCGTDNRCRCDGEHCAPYNHFSSNHDRYPNSYTHLVTCNDCARRDDTCGNDHDW